MTIHYDTGKTEAGDRVMRCGQRIDVFERRGRTTTARRVVTCKRCLTLVARDKAKVKAATELRRPRRKIA